VEEPEDDLESFGILPENVEVLNWFLRMQTQWRVGMSGPTGMDYGLFLHWSNDEGVRRPDRVWMLDDLRLMERWFLNSLYPGETGR
jgi:hypothetical protein